MIEWLSANKEWFLSGLGVALLGGVGVVFGWLKPKHLEQGHVVVQILQNEPATTVTAVSSKSVVPLERIVKVTPYDIEKTIKQAPPLQQESVSRQYVGLRVEWETRLLAASEKSGIVSLHLQFASEETMFPPLISCEVSLEDYRELAILQKGSKIRVSGVIESAERLGINLREAKLAFVEPDA